MRENPWHLRLPTFEDYQWFRNLVELHELTVSWLTEIENSQPSQLISRGFSPEVSENLWMLDSISKTDLTQLLDDTSPSDMLGRLDRTIWAVQSWTLGNLQGRTQSTHRESLDSMMEQTSWNQGRSAGQKRWPQLTKADPQELKRVLSAINDSPFSGYPKGAGFLLKRATDREIQIELRFCPHRSPYDEVGPSSDRLCRLHAHWMQGFVYALNSKLKFEHVLQSPRCTQRWSMV